MGAGEPDDRQTRTRLSAFRAAAAIRGGDAGGPAGVEPVRSLSGDGLARLSRRPCEGGAGLQGFRRRLPRQARCPSRGGPKPERTLHEAVTALREMRGPARRIISYAGLIYAGDTTDPKRAKFYGDAQERLTAGLITTCSSSSWSSTGLDDARLDAIAAKEPLSRGPPEAGGHPHGEAVPARRQAWQLFHEKSVTGPGSVEQAFRRDDLVAEVQGRRGRAHVHNRP